MKVSPNLIERKEKYLSQLYIFRLSPSFSPRQLSRLLYYAETHGKIRHLICWQFNEKSEVVVMWLLSTSEAAEMTTSKKIKIQKSILAINCDDPILNFIE